MSGSIGSPPKITFCALGLIWVLFLVWIARYNEIFLCFKPTRSIYWLLSTFIWSRIPCVIFDIHDILLHSCKRTFMPAVLLMMRILLTLWSRSCFLNRQLINALKMLSWWLHATFQVFNKIVLKRVSLNHSLLFSLRPLNFRLILDKELRSLLTIRHHFVLLPFSGFFGAI